MEINQIINQEYSLRADEIRKKMVVQSFYKYGPAKKNFNDKLVNSMGCMDMCVEKYNTTGNTEYLLDAMNYLMFEFMYPQKDGAFYKPTDSGESAGIEGQSYNQMMEEMKEDY